MPDTQSSTGSLPASELHSPLREIDHRGSALICNGSLQNKAVRFGSLEPALITLLKRSTRPLIAILTLGLCTIMFRQSWTVQFSALGSIAFIVAAQIFSPLDLASGKYAKPVPNAARILLEWSCVAALLTFVAVCFKLTEVFPRDMIIVWFLTTPIALLVVDSFGYPISKWLAGERALIQRYIIIGANEVGVELARRIEHSHAAGNFLGFLDFRSADRLIDILEKRVTGSCSARDLADFVRNNSIGRVYLALPISPSPRIAELVKELRDTTASVYFVPNIFAFDLVQARCVAIDGMPAFSICDSPLQGMSGVWKRLFDVIFASIALLLAWPTLLAVAFAIKQSSPGPILFKQRRYGLNGEEILVYKFRSMTVCEDGPVVTQAMKKDARVTRLGAFLRRTSLDELPQIFNVLEGKMSFVGPRPHAVAHNEEYRKLINGYMIRHKVRPGITGWAQVNGHRGETSTVDKMHQRIQYDLDYLKNWSLWLDLKIIAKTALLVVHNRDVY